MFAGLELGNGSLLRYFRDGRARSGFARSDDPAKGTVRISASAAVKMLIHILEEMALGDAITLIPVHAELTTQEAAHMLNFSRPSVIHLLNEGKSNFAE